MVAKLTAAGLGLALSVLCLVNSAKAQPFTGSTGWGTIGIFQTENVATCSLYQFGAFFPAGDGIGLPTSLHVSYPAHLVGTAADFIVTYSASEGGASIEFLSDNTASVVIAEAGVSPGPVVSYAVGTYTGGVTQQGGIEWTNIVFNYTTGGVACSAQLYGTFFATPVGG